MQLSINLLELATVIISVLSQGNMAKQCNMSIQFNNKTISYNLSANEACLVIFKDDSLYVSN